MCTATSRRVGIAVFWGLFFLLTDCQRHHSSRELLVTLDPHQSGIDFRNDVRDTEELNIIKYLYFYNGGGVACGDVNGDGLPDLIFGANQSSNALFINQGNLKFKRDSLFSAVDKSAWTTGISMLDINGDGLLDIYVCNVAGHAGMEGANALYINKGLEANGQVRFEESAAEYGLDYVGLSSQALFLDYDLDNDLDLFLLCHSVHSTETYRDTSMTRRNHLQGDRFFRNEGSSRAPKYVDVTREIGIFSGIAGYGLGASIGDFNLDSYPDLYIANDFHENDYLYLNTGEGHFEEVISKAMGHTSTFSMGCDIADLNNDGLLDILSLDMKPISERIRRSTVGEDSYEIQRFKNSFGYHNQLPRNCIQLNQGFDKSGVPHFAEVAQQLGLDATDWSWSGLMMDLDLNGELDIFITNGIHRRPNDLDYLKYIANAEVQADATDLELLEQMPSGNVENLYFLQRQESFERTDLGLAGSTQGAIYADLDGDGDLDMALNNMNGVAQILENTARDRLSDQFITVRPSSTLAPILGTKIWLYQGQKIQYRELQRIRGWLSSVEPDAHFGLDGRPVDSIVLVHPTLGSCRFIQPSTNSLLEINLDSVVLERSSDLLSQSSRPSSKRSTPFKHLEDEFYDYTREPLIPRLLSREGPALAVGDLDGDGIDEIFIGGGSGQSGVVLAHIDSSWGRQYYLTHSEEQEDVTACMFDIDNDQDLDLFVGSAGFRAVREDALLLDRIYINDGAGNLTYDPQALPAYFIQTSSADHSDVDGDGDEDLFIGGRGIPFGYGRPSAAYLLLNDGQGQFSIDSSQQEHFSQYGMITDLTFADIDGDQDEDIVSVGEWESPKVLHNDSGKFSLHDSGLDQFLGWWECVKAADLDGDGSVDLILGNLGANHSLSHMEGTSVRLYINDFDANLTNEIILTTQDSGKDLPLASLDELTAVLPSLAKKFRSHHTFAQADLKDIFGDKLGQSIVKQANSLRSVIAWNDGSGHYNIEYLPPLAQRSVTRSIVELPGLGENSQFLLGGNFHHFRPDIGRQDATHGLVVSVDGQRNVNITSYPEILLGEIRALAIAKGLEEEYLIVAKNDDWVEIVRLEGTR